MPRPVVLKTASLMPLLFASMKMFPVVDLTSPAAGRARKIRARRKTNTGTAPDADGREPTPQCPARPRHPVKSMGLPLAVRVIVDGGGGGGMFVGDGHVISSPEQLIPVVPSLENYSRPG